MGNDRVYLFAHKNAVRSEIECCLRRPTAGIEKAADDAGDFHEPFKRGTRPRERSRLPARNLKTVENGRRPESTAIRDNPITRALAR